jgi:lipopolysaccharide export system protein LptA
MKKKQRSMQFGLVSIGLFLIIMTYFYFPSIKKNKILKDQPVNKEPQKVQSTKESTYFENLEYKGLYDLDKPFSVKSKEAYILNEEPDIVYMDNMYVILYLEEDRIVEITSLKGRYNKENYNCFFDQDVLATDGDTVITANNLDLIATKNIMKIYNNVNLNNITSSLQADKIDYNFKTKYFKVSMFDDKEIEMQFTQ